MFTFSNLIRKLLIQLQDGV